MTLLELGRQIVRATLCLDQYEFDVTITGSDRIPAGAPSPLYVDVRAAPGASAGAAPAQEVTLGFVKRTPAAAGEIRFDSADGPTTRAFPSGAPQLVTLVGRSGTVGAEPDVTLEVRIGGEVRRSVPMSVGPPSMTVIIEGASGGPPPDKLLVGQPVRLRAVARGS